ICCDSRRRGAVARVEESVVDDLVDQCLSTLATAPAAIVATPSLRHDGWLDRGWHLSERSARRFRPLVPVRKMLTAAKLFTGDYSQAWQPMARAVAARLAQRHPISACIGEHSPDAGLFLARSFSQRARVPWIADFRDPILQPFGRLGRRLHAPVARWLTRTACATVAVNGAW